MPMSGIYGIKCNGRLYIGRAANLGVRWTGHLTALTQGSHHNKALQADFDQHGPNEFAFTVLELCDIEQLEERERVHVWRLRREGIYNIQIIPTRALPSPDPLVPAETGQDLAQRYRNLRLSLGMTQAELSYVTGAGQPTISTRETGKAPVTRETLMALLWLKTLPRERLDALLADPSKLEN